MSISQTTSPIPDVSNYTVVYDDHAHMRDGMDFWMQLASISFATQELFLGTTVLQHGALNDHRSPGQPSFLDIKVGPGILGAAFSWGDVLKGIEEISHNVTAALLTMHLGTMNAECAFDQQVVVYRYSFFGLWVPYGVSNFSLLSPYGFTFFPIIFIDSLGRCCNFTRCCCHDNGEK
jgi:hypothetical protein